MKSIAGFLDAFHLKDGWTYRGLTVVPICRTAPPTTEENLLSLREAMANRLVDAMETGRMDRVALRSRTADRLLALEGETLLGGAQNRVLNIAALLPPRGHIELSASCVEVKRWDIPARSKEPPEEKRAFTRSGFAHAGLRRMQLEAALKSAAVDREVSVDQRGVWEHIVKRFLACDAVSPTIDLHDLYAHWEPALDTYARRFPTIPGQAGVMVLADRADWFVDLFRDRDLLLEYHKQILRGHALDDLIRESEPQPHEPRPPTLKDARDRFRGLRVTRTLPPLPHHPNLVLFHSAACRGMALIADGELLHLSACSVEVKSATTDEHR